MTKLRLFGPYDICSGVTDVLGDCPYAKDEGIYFWAVEQPDGKYKITYIGETSASFYKRTKEHIIQTLGGNYLVCDGEALQRGELVTLWKGTWRKGTRDKLPEFMERYEELAPKIKQYLTVQKLFVLPFKAERRERQRIEGALSKLVVENEKASSIMPKDIRYYYRRPEEEIINVTITGGDLVEGLPTEFEA